MLHNGAPPACGLEGSGDRAQCSGMCHPGLRQAREAAWHPSDRRASPSAGECSRGGGSCGDRPGPTVAGSRLGPAGASGVVDLCHPGLRHAREAAWHVPDERASLPAGEGPLCGGEHGDRSDSTVLGAGLGLLAGAPAALGMCVAMVYARPEKQHATLRAVHHGTHRRASAWFPAPDRSSGQGGHVGGLSARVLPLGLHLARHGLSAWPRRTPFAALAVGTWSPCRRRTRRQTWRAGAGLGPQTGVMVAGVTAGRLDARSVSAPWPWQSWQGSGSFW